MKTTLHKIGLLMAVLLASLTASAYDFEVDGIYYNVVSLQDLTCEVTYGDEKYSGDIEIPAEVIYKNKTLSVVSISSHAFRECSSLTSVTIPDSVTSIGNGAFDNCSSLTSVNIPNSVTEIEHYAFYGCSSLTSVTIPDSVTEIGYYAFSGCSSLTSVTIPDSVEYIYDGAFYYCTSLIEIRLSESLKTFSNWLFAHCHSLESITIPGSVEKFEKNGSFYFFNCKNLKTLKFMHSETHLTVSYQMLDEESDFSNPDNPIITDIPLEIENLFIDREVSFYTDNIRHLKELTLGSHLDKFSLSISNCEDLETVTCYSTIPPSVSTTFSNAQYINVVVKVPYEALEAYQQADVWKNFWNLEGFDASGVENVKADSSEKSEIGRYDLNGRSISEDFDGISIIRYSDGSTKKMIGK